MKKFASLILLITAFFTPASATSPDNDFSSFMKESLSDFNSFIDQANKDFISFMRNPWKKYDSEKPVEKRSKPEPVKQPVYEPSEEPKEKSKPTELSIEEILDLTTRQSEEKPSANVSGGKSVDVDMPEFIPIISDKPKQTPEIKQEPVVKPEIDKPVKNPPVPTSPAKKPEENQGGVYSPEEGREKVTYAGVNYYLPSGVKNKLRLKSLSENHIADAYEACFNSDYKELIADLKKIKQNDLKNEWALQMVVKKFANSVASGNEAVVLRQFILNQMGYKARIAKVNNSKLTLFVSPDTELYGCIYVDLNGTKFYDVDAKEPYSFYMCRKDSPDARRKIGMGVDNLPRTGSASSSAVHSVPGIQVNTIVSKDLMDFYNDMPQCDYKVYVNAPISSTVKEQILTPLRKAIQGKDEQTAAGILLDFCQNGFQYATDDQQFGYEKPFFIEETFYYPKCDCEDRSILYMYLVKELLGLDVVLLEYPGHIATAVNFKTNVPGDYVTVSGKKYTVCDPTYINASVGMAMPMFKNVSAKVLKY